MAVRGHRRWAWPLAVSLALHGSVLAVAFVRYHHLGPVQPHPAVRAPAGVVPFIPAARLGRMGRRGDGEGVQTTERTGPPAGRGPSQPNEARRAPPVHGAPAPAAPGREVPDTRGPDLPAAAARPAVATAPEPGNESGADAGTADGRGSAAGAGAGGAGESARGSGTGTGTGGGGLAPSCWSEVARELATRARAEVPRALRDRALTGEVVVAFEIGDGGAVTRARVERSSGHTLLDEAALALVSRPFATDCRGASRWPVRWRARATP